MRQSSVISHQSSVASPQSSVPDALTRRVVIENIRPEIDGGRFSIKRTIGEPVVVTADIFADGHDVIAAALQYGQERREGPAPLPALPAPPALRAQEAPMTLV